MNFYRFLNTPPYLLFRLASCDTSWKIRQIRAEAGFGLLHYVTVSHYFFFFHSFKSRFVSFACFSIDPANRGAGNLACAAAFEPQHAG